MMKIDREWLKKEFGSYSGLKDFMVDPEMAERLLNANTHNRRISELRIRRYEKAILDGRWGPSNDCIVFFENGCLCNGQSRLWALANLKDNTAGNNIKIPLTIKWGVPNQQSKNVYVMDYIDRGRGRTSGQNWGLRNKLESTKTTHIAAAANLLAKIFLPNCGMLEAPHIDFIYKSYKEEFDKVMDLDRGTRRISRAPIWAGLVFAAKVNLEKVCLFEESLFTGENLPPGNSILTFRNRIFIGEMTEGRRRISVFKELLTAIRAYIEDEQCFKIYTNDKGYLYFYPQQESIIHKIIDVISLNSAQFDNYEYDGILGWVKKK